ncbi:lantibiotic dehydratase [Streptomyces sp. NPDC058867]|uniref:lantibiotic dehydratase n=1 Tax=unclassified Streptomyces TaxID=2593676 RepID=UPI0036B680F3
MYRHVDAALVRASAWDPGRPTVWPDLTDAFAGPASWQAWLQQVWSDSDFAAAVRAASPDLATRVEQICAGEPVPLAAVRRTVVAVLRYLLRARTRATPFGLFAGIAAVRIGPAPALRVGTGHRAVARADAAHSTALTDLFEQHPVLRPRLMLLASSLLVERDGYVVIEHRPSKTLDRRPENVQVRLSAPVREALEGARTHILWSDLAVKLSTSFPSARPYVIDRLIADLVRQRVLLTSLRSAMTVIDPLTALVEHAAHLPPAEAAVIQSAPRLARDLRVDWDLTVPLAVVQEAAAAAKALIRLAPQASLTGWAEWHRRFLDRYGPRAAVPVLDAIDVLGYPAGFLGATTAPTASPLPDRVRRLIRLAYTAGMRRRREIQLDDAAIADLATVDPGRPVQPSTELTVRIDAESMAAFRHGEFTLNVVGVARSAGATTGRFLHLLDDEDRRRMTETYGALPPVHQGALHAQISSTPLSAPTENVARAPQATEWVISLGDFHSPDTRLVPLTDLAVTADAEQLHLVSMSHRRPVHTLLLNAVDLGHHSHPLCRFLTEVPAALAVPCTGFRWGTAASSLPFLPALRYGRTILSPARWLLTREDLPPASAPWEQWDETLTRWRHAVHLPERVYLSEDDQRLALDLAEPSHRALLRVHLDRDGTVSLCPAPRAKDLGWTGGRAHEVVIPLSTEQNITPVRAAHRPVTRDHSHLPGCDNRISLHLHGHRHRQNPILTRHLAALQDELGNPPWWYIRYRDPDDHLRLRLTCQPGTLGSVLESIGQWTRRLWQHGLITHTSVETYHPETARFGGPTALEAAERYFTADSAAAVAQLAAHNEMQGPDLRAVTAASMTDIAVAMLGDSGTAMQWMIEHTRTDPNAPPRTVYRQAVDLVNTPPASLSEDVSAAWSARRGALAEYRQTLTDTALRPDELLPDLLHLHHVRMCGPGLPEERTHLHLARAAALSWTARARSTL